jgi:hypothetical protein
MTEKAEEHTEEERLISSKHHFITTSLRPPISHLIQYRPHYHSLSLLLPALLATEIAGFPPSPIPKPPLITGGPPSIIFGFSYSSSVESDSESSTFSLRLRLLLSSLDGSRSPRSDRSRLWRSCLSLLFRRLAKRSSSSAASSLAADLLY